MLQDSRWESTDGQELFELAWRLKVDDPDFSTVLNDRVEYRSPFHQPQGITSYIKQSQQDLHCTAMNISADMTRIFLDVVNCSQPFWSRVMCASDRQITHKQKIKDEKFGYFISTNLDNDKQLTSGGKLCPKGYKLFVDMAQYRRCCKIIPVNKAYMRELSYFHPQEYKDWYGTGRPHRELGYYEEKKKERHLIGALNKLCEADNKRAEFYQYPSGYSIELDFLLKLVARVFFGSLGVFYSIERLDPNTQTLYWEFMCFDNWRFDPLLETSHGYTVCGVNPNDVGHVEHSDTDSNTSVLYECANKQLISTATVCDGRDQCGDNREEYRCPTLSCPFPDCACDVFFFHCRSSGQCILYDHVCDDIYDCADGEDEQHCDLSRTFVLDYTMDIGTNTGGMMPCETTHGYFSFDTVCEYDTHSDGSMFPCADGSHIGVSGRMCMEVVCYLAFKCKRSYCIPVRKVCDGVIDCVNGDDEEQCGGYICPNHFKCYNSSVCLPLGEVCDGVANCPHKDDERYCQVCPEPCHCHGTSLSCSNVLDRINIQPNFQKPAALILFNSGSVFQQLQEYKILDNGSDVFPFWLLRLEIGDFTSLISNADSNTDSLSLGSVKVVYILHYRITSLKTDFLVGDNVRYLNLSYNMISSVHGECFRRLTNLIYLILEHNAIKSLADNPFSNPTNLKYLLMEDNPLKLVSQDVFANNTALLWVRSDYYMLCCVAKSIPDLNCSPVSTFISTCDNLISSVYLKSVVMLQGFMTTFGNIAALYVRIFVEENKSEQYLIISLIIADLMMGCYLNIIAYVDVAYYYKFYSIILNWKKGKICMSLGWLNFVSSEVSLFLLTLLSVARAVSIEQIGGMQTYKTPIRIISIVIWLSIALYGFLYVVLINYLNQGMNNNICIIYGKSRDLEISLVEQILQFIIITANFLCILVICGSIAAVFHIITKSIKSVKKIGANRSGSNGNQVAKIGIRLLLLLLCNLLSWIPLMVISTVLLSGVNVREVLLQWMITLLLPISSSTNPVLYSQAAFKKCFSGNKDKKKKHVK